MELSKEVLAMISSVNLTDFQIRNAIKCVSKGPTKGGVQLSEPGQYDKDLIHLAFNHTCESFLLRDVTFDASDLSTEHPTCNAATRLMMVIIVNE